MLHYCKTQRDDTPLWRYCQSMEIPDSLRERIELFRHTGRIRPKAGELFTDLSWFYIFEGLGVRPESYDPLIDIVRKDKLEEILRSMALATTTAMRASPSHDSYFLPSGPTSVRAAAP